MSDLVVALKITGDPSSAKAALEEVRRSQLSAFAAGREAADKSALTWKVAEAEVKRLARSIKESGGNHSELSAKMAEAVAEAGRAKAAYDSETASLQKRRQALAENKAALEQMAAAARQAQAAQQGSAPGETVDNARNMLGVVPHAQIYQQIQAVRQAYQDLRASGVLTGAELAQASDRARARIMALGEGLNGAKTAADKMAMAVGLVQRAWVALQAIAVGNAILKAADEMVLLNARMKLVEGSAEGAGKAMDGVAKIAIASAIPIQDAGKAYLRYAQSIYSLGGSQQQALAFTEAIALAMRVSGTSAQESGAAMMQLGQAMQKGMLNGDEFVSVAENGGKVLDYLAQALGVSRGKLREMSTEGKLTADKLLRITDVLGKIRKDAEGLPPTVGAAVAELNTRWDQWIEKSQLVKAASAGVSGSLKFVGDNLDSIAWTGAALGAVLFMTQLTRLTKVIRLAGLAMGVLNFTPVGLALSAVAISAAWAMGQWSKESEAAESSTGKLTTSAKRAEDGARALANGVKSASESIGEAFDKASKKSEELAQKVAEHGRAARDNQKGQYDTQLRVIEDHYAQAGRLLEASSQRERTKIREGAAFVVQAEGEKLAATRSWATEAERVSQRTNAEIVRLTQAAGRDVAQAERTALQERISIYGQVESAYRSTIDRLIAEEARHLQAAREAEDARYMLKLSVEDRIRTLKQKAMSDVAAYYDRERQIQEKTAAAQEELQKGNFSEAKRLAEEAIALAERNATAVSKTVEEGGQSVTKTVISQSAASTRAIKDIEAAAKIADNALQGLGRSHSNAARSVGDSAKEATDGLNTTLAKLEQLRTAMGQNIAVTMKVDSGDVAKAINELGTLAEAKAITVRLKLNTDALNEALAEMERTPAKAAELSVQARLKLDDINADLGRLQQLAAQQKLELPAELKTEMAAQNIANLRQFLAQPTSATHTPVPDLSAYNQAVSQLQQPTSSVHTVYVRTVEQHSVGGLVGAGTAALATLPRFATGGALPGYGGGDRIHALLEAGEYIMRKEAVRHYGIDAMAAINERRAPLPAFAVGGIVMPSSQGGGTGGGSRDVVDVRVSVPGADRPVMLSGTRDEAYRLAAALNGIAKGVS